MAVSTVKLNNTVLMTVNDTTSVAADVAQGKYFYNAAGVKTAGTASGGGGGSVSPKMVNFIDYDGTLLYSYTTAEFANLSALPANPSHAGLVAQGWTWTKAEITAQLTVTPNQSVWVGQMYITASGDTEIDVVLDSEHLSPWLTIAVNGSVTVDWGDNTVTDTVTGTDLTTVKYTLHEYASAGEYTISISVNSGSFTFYNSSNTKASVLSAYGADSNRRYNREYAGTINAIRIGSGVTSIGNNAFSNCYALQSLTIPDDVTSIGTYAFNNCYALQSITIPDDVTSIETYAFRYCYALQSITISDGVTSIGNYAFYGCYALQSITIPDGVTSIGTYAFNSCYTLQSITIPDDVTSIETYAFYGCYALQSITISDGVTSIGNYAFYGCYALQSITIPDGVTSIGTYAFNNCYAVEKYHLLPTTPPTLANTNAFTGIVAGTKIYVPYSANHSILAAYRSATNWSTYASYMEEEPQ